MKKVFSVILILILLFSCSKENLFEFKDLTAYDDYIYRVGVIPKDESKPIEFTVVLNQTNGYDQYISYPYSLGPGIISYDFAVKGYKRNGVKVYPQENIEEVIVELRKIGWLNDVEIQYFSPNSKPIFVGYNFDTDEKIIEYLED